MRFRRSLCVALLFVCSATAVLASAYNAHPRLVVVIVIDQFRGDYLERYRNSLERVDFDCFLIMGLLH